MVNHPITKWSAETYILRPAVDLVVNEKVYQSFLSSHKCQVEIVDGGEHWLHTPEQLAALSQWENKVISSINDRKDDKVLFGGKATIKIEGWYFM